MHTNGIITSTYIEITESKFNKIKWNHKSQGRQQESKEIHFLVRDKTTKSNIQCKDDQYIYHMIEYQLSKDKIYLELFSGGSLQINPRSSSQQISIWKRIRIKHHPNKYMLDRLK
jgi:hypothetical protein